MLDTIKSFVLTFIPIFVAVDAVGNIPIFVSLVDGVSKREKRKVIIDSVTIATVVAVLFLLIGKLILRFVGITIADFQIAGGILLFVIAVRLLLPGSSKIILSDGREKDIGIFPLGLPLITGPAVLTTTLMMLDSFGFAYTLTSLVLNMFIVWVTLVKADSIIKYMGPGGTRAFSKIMYILLAAIAVMMVRKGIIATFIK